MDQIRTIAQNVAFWPLRPEFTFALPDDRKEYLKDITLCLVTKAGENLHGAGCDNVHLYVDGADITAAYIAELKLIIEATDQQSLKQQYVAAMDRWLQLADALGSAAYGTDVATEHQRAAQLALTTPLSSLANKIGDTQQGWSGHLHLLNFHDQFSQPFTVSLGKVLVRHNANSHTAPITALTAKIMTISSARSASYDAGYNSNVDVSRGAVSIQFDLIYHDPLEDVIKELQDEFTALQGVIDQNLTAITQALSTGGPIQRRLNNVDQQVTAAQQGIDQARRDLVSQDAHMSALENTLNDIKRMVQGL